MKCGILTAFVNADKTSNLLYLKLKYINNKTINRIEMINQTVNNSFNIITSNKHTTVEIHIHILACKTYVLTYRQWGEKNL
jgi:hypothetical protein